MGVNLTQEELNAIFVEIDKDDNKLADIDELVCFVTNKTNFMDQKGLLCSALIKIRGCKYIIN